MSVGTKTLNQIIELFEEFATAHPQINDFGYGATSDIGQTKQMEFPYLWLSHQSDSVIKVNNKTQTPEMRFYCLFMDKVSEQPQTNDSNGFDSNNGQEILSDEFQKLQDLIAVIATEWRTKGITINEDVRCFPAIDETTDKVNGFVGEITLRFTYNNSSCSVI